MNNKKLNICIVLVIMIRLTKSHHHSQNGQLKSNKNKNYNIFEDISILSSSILFQLNPRHCYAIITDPIYFEILYESKFFELLKYKSSYLIKVTETEDLLSPKRRTIKSLIEIHRAGCDAYLIFISNGIQLKRFLRFAYKFRTLDSQANFLILHDYRLFTPDLHFIWKRFINVVFIKLFERKENKGSDRNLFELVTVPFPQQLNNLFVSKRLDFWRSGKFQYGVDLFQDKTRNLEGKLMKVAVIEHTPAVFKSVERNATKYSGIEIELINTLSTPMNFKIKYYESYDAEKEKWGRQYENETFTGLYGEIIDDHADFALGDLHYTKYNLELMDLSIPYLTECLTFLTPESLSDNSWKVLILPFSESMWIGVITSLFSVGFVFYGLSKIHTYLKPHREQKIIGTPVMTPDLVARQQMYNNSIVGAKKFKRKSVHLYKVIYKDTFDDIVNCIMYTYSMLLVISIPRLPKSWSIRLLTGWYWIYCLLVVVAYRASMTAILANPMPKVTIETMQELADSSIACGAWSKQTKEFFENSLDVAGQKIGKKLKQIDDIDTVIEYVARGFYAYYENEYFLKEIRSKRASINEQQNLHIMKECSIHMPIALGLQKNSPIKLTVDKYLRFIIESGLTRKWLSDAIEEFQSNVESQPQQALMDLKKLYGALLTLCIGLSAATIVFLFELWYWKVIVEKKPNYDKLIYGKFR